MSRKNIDVIGSHENQKPVKPSKLFSALKVTWQFLINIFTNQPELKIWQRSDRGNTWWEIYEPATGRAKSFGSEYEVLAWIEQRYSNLI